MVLAERVRRLSGVCLLRLSTPVARSRAASTSWSRSRSCSCGSSRSFFEVRVAVGACVPGVENMRVPGLPRLRMELTSAHMATGFQSVVW